jgi:hypothetical protein
MKEFTIVRGLLDNRKRSLIIDDNFIKFENKDQNNDFLRLLKRKILPEFAMVFIL